jgi:phosphopantothenoylcysteine decarboxylase/phosphopantothenate--cysteine ligase
MPEMQPLKHRRIVLGLTGGIACYKAAELTRELIKAGASVQVVMTSAAEAFITPVTMQALSGRVVYTSQWDAREGNNMAHINLTRDADAVLVAPASADFITKLAHGAADDLLSLLCAARRAGDEPRDVGASGHATQRRAGARRRCHGARPGRR